MSSSSNRQATGQRRKIPWQGSGGRGGHQKYNNTNFRNGQRKLDPTHSKPAFTRSNSRNPSWIHKSKSDKINRKVESSEEGPADKQEKKVNFKKTAMQKAREQFNKTKETSVANAKARKIAEEERKVKREQNITQRRENYKVFSKKTRKGQPVMADRIELLLKKIQSKN